MSAEDFNDRAGKVERKIIELGSRLGQKDVVFDFLSEVDFAIVVGNLKDPRICISDLDRNVMVMNNPYMLLVTNRDSGIVGGDRGVVIEGDVRNTVIVTEDNTVVRDGRLVNAQSRVPQVVLEVPEGFRFEKDVSILLRSGGGVRLDGVDGSFAIKVREGRQGREGKSEVIITNSEGVFSVDAEDTDVGVTFDRVKFRRGRRGQTRSRVLTDGPVSIGYTNEGISLVVYGDVILMRDGQNYIKCSGFLKWSLGQTNNGLELFVLGGNDVTLQKQKV